MKNERLENNREQFLRDLKKIASQAADVEEIAYKLDFENKASLEKFLSDDKEAYEIWHQGRLDCWIKAKNAIVEAAGRGNATAISILDGLLKDEKEGKGFSERVNITELSKLTGRSAQTVHNWIKAGLPREKDKTFFLPKFIDWFEKYKFDLGKKKAGKPKGTNELQKMKTKKLELELQREKGELLNRGEVLAGLIARHQRFLQTCGHLTDIATQLEGKSLKQIVEILEKFFEKLVEIQRDELGELRLSTQSKKKFFELLNILKDE